MGLFLVFASSCKKDDPIVKKDVVITWANPSDLVAGTPLSATQLNATASVHGSFVYTPAIGTVLNVGSAQILKVDFTPTDIENYNSSTKKVQINVTTTFTDSRDGNVYKTVIIGNQNWMAENLKYLPSVVGPATGSEVNPYYYVYDYDGTSLTAAKATTNYATYGVLYNFAAARIACPLGWHLPSDTEWTELENYLANNGYNYDGTIGSGREKIAKSMASASGWSISTNIGCIGNPDYNAFINKSGFTALPGGYRNGGGYFSSIGYHGSFWSATYGDNNNAWRRGLGYGDTDVNRNYDFKEFGLSVRCIKD